MKYRITVFTPTYNRATQIIRVYSSLLKQTYKNFEWVIVDDGSTDNTEKIISEFVNENIINIVYYKTKNGGKHRAINKGVSLSNGELFFIVDSDDYIVENALEVIINNWDKVEKKSEFCGVAGLKGYHKNRVVGNSHKESVFDCSIIDYRYKYRIKGDKAEVFLTELLRNNKFPEIEDEKFISESIIWNKLGSKYKMRWVNEIIYICNYLDNGLSDQSFFLRKKNVKGTLLVYKANLLYDIPFVGKAKSSANYYRFAYHNKLKISKVWIETSSIILNIIGIIIGYLVYLKDSCFDRRMND